MRDRVLVTLAVLAGTPADAGLEAEAALGWESSYISEGRKVREAGEGLYTALLLLEEQAWSLEGWMGANPAADFTETSLSLGRQLEFSAVSARLGYTLVSVRTEGTSEPEDHEAFLSLAVPLGEDVEAGLDLVYGHLSSGAYAEAFLAHARPLTERLEMAVVAAVATDFGYASEEGIHGLSHGRVGLEFTLVLSEHLQAFAFTSAILPLEGLRREDEHSTIYGGMSLRVSF
ncbi:MAG: hypothetical protein ACLFU2_00040 [Opitutales bacterium]